jgi:hypothetical protein
VCIAPADDVWLSDYDLDKDKAPFYKQAVHPNPQAPRCRPCDLDGASVYLEGTGL